jgi:hypothetical protein
MRRVYAKELLREGKLYDGKKYHTITPEILENCVTQFKRMQEAGKTVSFHSEHEYTPESKVGELEDMWLDRDDDGQLGIFGKVHFLEALSDERVGVLTSCDVSVEIPKQMYDGKGNLYTMPVKRVAVTADPVVMGMEPFLRLSLNARTNDKENDMALEQDAPGEAVEPQGGLDADESPLLKMLIDVLEIDPNQFQSDEELLDAIASGLGELLAVKAQMEGGGEGEAAPVEGGEALEGEVAAEGGEPSAPAEGEEISPEEEQYLQASLNAYRAKNGKQKPAAASAEKTIADSIFQYREELILSLNISEKAKKSAIETAHRINPADTPAFASMWETLKLSQNATESRTAAQVAPTKTVSGNPWKGIIKKSF